MQGRIIHGMIEKSEQRGRRRKAPNAADSAEPDDKRVGERIRDLRDALDLTQVQLVDRMKKRQAENCGRSGKIDQSYISNVETGKLTGTTDLARSAFAEGFGISRSVFNDYIDGALSLEQTLAARNAASSLSLENHPSWSMLVDEARGLRPHLRPEAFAEVGRWPSAGRLESFTGYLLADCADVVQRWSDLAASKK